MSALMPAEIASWAVARNTCVVPAFAMNSIAKRDWLS
ncbi:hypothetical protein R76696_04620 [Ralstonia mannitolilytica]|nr:hypothetical protein R76696_04620 [Ralstonia mannitolilytica]